MNCFISIFRYGVQPVVFQYRLQPCEQQCRQKERQRPSNRDIGTYLVAECVTTTVAFQLLPFGSCLFYFLHRATTTFSHHPNWWLGCWVGVEHTPTPSEMKFTISKRNSQRPAIDTVRIAPVRFLCVSPSPFWCIPLLNVHVSHLG